MKIELHAHTYRYSACSRVTPTQLAAAAIRSGYEGLFITEHDAVWTEWEMDLLREEFPQLRIFPGIEVTVESDWMLHVLVLGTHDPKYTQITDYSELIETAREDELLTVLAHPYRSGDFAGELLEAAPRPDAIEYMTNNQEGEQSKRAARTASRFGLKLLNAGDTHAAFMLDRYYIETARPVEYEAEIRDIILNGEYENRSV
ncbi:MAG: PHP domain-containing protein [Phycisphaerae bacterium]